MEADIDPAAAAPGGDTMTELLEVQIVLYKNRQALSCCSPAGFIVVGIDACKHLTCMCVKHPVLGLPRQLVMNSLDRVFCFCICVSAE